MYAKGSALVQEVFPRAITLKACFPSFLFLVRYCSQKSSGTVGATHRRGVPATAPTLLGTSSEKSKRATSSRLPAQLVKRPPALPFPGLGPNHALPDRITMP